MTATVRPRPGNADGFTLLEMLVVLGILSLLMGWVLSVTAMARQRAGLTVCTSNLRQLLHAVTLYENDHSGVPVHFSVGDVQGPAGHWQAKLAPYLGGRAVLVCRSDPTGGIDRAWGGWPCSYNYSYTSPWLGPRGQYRRPSTRSPLLACVYHAGQHPRGTGHTHRVGRYDGSVTWGVGNFDPEDGRGLLR